MRVAILGRSELLLDSARAVAAAGHAIVVVGTGRAETHYKVGQDDFARFAADMGADFFVGGDLESDERQDRLAVANADVAVSINWRSVLGPRMCGAFRHGILNCHGGDLPRYRGNACQAWAILAGEPSVGVCIHRMIPNELDNGPIGKREVLPIDARTYVGDVLDWFLRRIPGMFVEVLAEIEEGRDSFVPQSTDEALWLRCYPRRAEDGRIDWRSTTESLHRLVRASSRPLDGAYTTIEGDTRLTVFRAEPASHPGGFMAVPGQVLYAVDGDPVIATGDGCLRLTDVATAAAPTHAAACAVVLRSYRTRLL